MDAQSYQALREHAAYIDLTGRGKIRVSGEDRARLLHAMCTNHVQNLQPGAGCYAFFLTAQGRIIADVNVYCMPDYLLLDTEPETRAAIMSHLDQFIIADDVSLADFTDTTSTLTIEGPAAEQILTSLGAVPAHVPFSLVEWGHSQIAHWTYTGAPGYAIYVMVDEKPALLEKLAGAGVPQADMATAEVVRLENGRPRYGTEITEANIPQETQQMGAVHLSKGCYLGQEIVERVRSRGHVNRVLASVEIDGNEPPAPGAKIQSSGADVGEVVSAAYSPAKSKVVGFARLRAEAAADGAELAVGGRRTTTVKRSAPTSEH